MYEQTDRPMKLTTPLGANALLLVGLQGREAISQMFHFELKTAWNDNSKLLPFDQLLGKKVTVEISPGKNKRYFNGIVCKVTQGERDENFTYYTLEVVPQLWLLDRKLCSRTFQHITVPDILKTLFTGMDVAYQIEGTFEQREYCVQYRETDFAFASRLMEEEGIFYFFKHSSSGHQMVLANTPQSHPAIPYTPTTVWKEASNAVLELRPRVRLEQGPGNPLRQIHRLGLHIRNAHQASGSRQDHHGLGDRGHRDPQAESGQQR